MSCDTITPLRTAFYSLYIKSILIMLALFGVIVIVVVFSAGGDTDFSTSSNLIGILRFL